MNQVNPSATPSAQCRCPDCNCLQCGCDATTCRCKPVGKAQDPQALPGQQAQKATTGGCACGCACASTERSQAGAVCG